MMLNRLMPAILSFDSYKESCDRFLTFGRRRNWKARLAYRRFIPNRIFTAGCNAAPSKMPQAGNNARGWQAPLLNAPDG
jgi:hypothetical protein